jgi:N-acetylmuramate 1-kinase
VSQDETRSRVWKYLEQHGLTKNLRQVVPLTGDASDRRYYRVILRGGDSMVLALHAGSIDFDRMAFVTVARLLATMNLPVPRILHHSDELGIIGLQDLGDVTLQAHLGAATPDEHDALYRQAVSLIARLQGRGAEFAAEDYPPYRVAFDTDKLAWEFEFFYKYFLKAYRGVSPSVAVQAGLSKEWSSIVEELAGEPRVLCHRDYHSRNLMLHGGELFIIDFQDARMGPDTYDLVSLLRDSYMDFTEAEVDELIAFFRALSGRRLEAGDEFRRRFDLMALQRNLKALGTFGFQTMSRGNPVYIQYMPRTISYARGALERHHRFSRLRELLAEHVEELR